MYISRFRGSIDGPAGTSAVDVVGAIVGVWKEENMTRTDARRQGEPYSGQWKVNAIVRHSYKIQRVTNRLLLIATRCSALTIHWLLVVKVFTIHSFADAQAYSAEVNCRHSPAHKRVQDVFDLISSFQGVRVWTFDITLSASTDAISLSKQDQK